PGCCPSYEATADTALATIDAEVLALIDDAHADAYWALNENRDVLDALAHELLEKETLDEAQLAELFAPAIKRERRTVWLASRDRPVSSRPPIDVPVSRRTAAAEAAEAQAAEAQRSEER